MVLLLLVIIWGSERGFEKYISQAHLQLFYGALHLPLEFVQSLWANQELTASYF